MDKINFLPRYPSNTPKYTTSVPYWIQNNLFSDINFCMHNNLKIIIEIFSTIYLSLAVIFPSVPYYWHRASWVHTTRNNFPWYGINRVNFQLPFINNNWTFKNNFNSIKFYTSASKLLYSLISPGKGNLIQKYVIFAAPIFFETRYFR